MLSTAFLVVIGTKRNGTPHETTCTGVPVPATAVGDSESASAAAALSASAAPKVGVICIIHTNVSSSPFHVSETGTGPTPRPKTNRSRPGAMTPLRASANVLPIVGWPAAGSSFAGVKMRIRTSVPLAGCSGGSTNVVSEKFISFAIACIVSVERPRPSRNTASWLPPKR